MRRLINAEMSEWFKEHDWKSCDAGTYPEVQILFSAPTTRTPLPWGVFLWCLPNLEEDLRVGAVLREHNALPRFKPNFINACGKGDN